MSEYSKRDGKKLLLLARESIAEGFGAKKPKIPDEKKFKEKRGVFVTLTLPLQKVAKESGLKPTKKLRGCVGFPYPILPLKEAVYKAAKSAGFYDPRFLPLQKSELKDIKIEISILSVPKQCSIYGFKVPGDGLMCECKGASGLLLPQVAVELNLNKTQFVEALCEKAGLARDSYKKQEFKLFNFQCHIFSE